MKRVFSLVFYLLLCSAFRVSAEELVTYSLGIPQPVALPSDLAGKVVDDNGWYATNNVYVGDGGQVFRTNETHLVSRLGMVTPAAALSRGVMGASWEISKPQYYLADRIDAPYEDDPLAGKAVDWDKTYTEYRKRYSDDAEQTCGFIFSNHDDSRGVYASRGGTYTFYWYFDDGSVETNTYIFGSVSEGRPKRIYWTDPPYNGEKVSLYGKFVRFFGDPTLVSNEYAKVTVTVGGVQAEQMQVVSGLYLDSSSMTLEARGTRTGQAVMAYYADANYDQVLHAQVIEVCAPDTIACQGEIGTPLVPTGRGYSITGLTAKVRAGLADSADGRGQYLYQHWGEHSYYPHYGDVYPIRPTNGERWKAEICWMEEDVMRVKWPFEIDQYENVWPTDVPSFVRGDLSNDTGRPITFPERYRASLMDYQEPNGHAKSVTARGTFSTDLSTFDTMEGLSLLKLTADNNIWFLPIKSVLRSNKAYYTLEPIPLPVGQEATLAAVPRSAVANDMRIAATSGAGVGYVYGPGSPNLNYDARLYTLTNSASAIFPVSTNGNLEVWWNAVALRDDMPEPIFVPTLPTVYRPYWPRTEQAPQIVLASQQGGAGESRYGHFGAATFDATNAVLTLPARLYFPVGDGTVMFWTRASADPNAGVDVCTKASGLIRFATEQGDVFGLRIGAEKKLELTTNGAVVVTAPLPPGVQNNEWLHVALSFDSDGQAQLYLNGTPIPASNGWTVPTSKLTGIRMEGQIGAARDAWSEGNVSFPAAAGRQVAEVLVYARRLDFAEVTNEIYRVHTGDEPDVTGYWSFRPDEDLAANGISNGMEERFFIDRAAEADEPCTAENVVLTAPGAPLDGPCILSSETEVTVYRQNDKKKAAYNPNEEHAFATAGSGGYVVWALRCDLGEKDAPQGVLAEYKKNGRNAMQFFHVVATNETWPVLGATCEAGFALPGPMPLTTFYDPWLTNDTWSGSAVFRDRKKQLWCIDGGAKPFDVFMWYRQQATFDWPDNKAPADGASVPWLAKLGKPDADPLTETPHPWRWAPHWPENVPQMKIGQTLTVAEDGLPEVWAARSIAVLYPDPHSVSNVVQLSDPTVQQSVPLSKADFDATGLSAGGNGGLTLRGGVYRFTEASPFISSRLGYDSYEQTLGLTGVRDVKNAGVSILYPNVLSKAERTATKALVKTTAEGWKAWTNAVNRLALGPVLPNTASAPKDNGTGGKEQVTTYGAVDHYALTALGMTNYVVLIENDASPATMKKGQNCPVKDGDPINMHVFKVTNVYYTARVVTRQDENNLLSQQLAVLYADPIGGKADGFEFEWYSHSPNADGSVPTPGTGNWVKRSPSVLIEGGSSAGLTRFVAGQQGDTLENMVNKYWTCRYRAVDKDSPAYKVMGDAYSAWCTPPALAEGWIQRVLNNVTPFNQRMTDLVNNKAETAVSMIQQAGAPFTGDVALNSDNLANVGLIQLYETLLNKAESMSLLLGAEASGKEACKQLLLAAERLHDLYKVLGDEAYSDAKNPTIGFGSTVSFAGTTQFAADFGAESSSLFCFDNQVKTLLDEEICLLRGRTGVSAPTCRVGPYYNRLVWNFTKGITAGEVAYAVNYGVSGTETLALSAEQAARVYPQGHGDAYGHYLSALKGWYRLLRNPNFTWGDPVQGEMNIADAAVNVDYYEEAKFAEAAVALAKTAADVVDLTARQAWRESAKEETLEGYLDSNTTNAFGYGEWASRGGYGALVNWAVANSLLPIDSTLVTNSATDLESTYTDTGLKRIDRGNVDELVELCETAATIVRTVDRIDAGDNPLGLSDNAIPFDITPKGVTDGSNTHYEQVRDRAKAALANARRVLDRAQTQSNRMRMIQETAESYANAITGEEEDLEAQLVGYYGTPYTGDIGPGKTYKQGYEGPDTLHYFYMDLDQYGLKENDLKITAAKEKVYSGKEIAKRTDYDQLDFYVHDQNSDKNKYTVPINLTRLGLVAKPKSVTGYRVSPGSIQTKYADLLLQLAAVNAAKATCDKAWEAYLFARSKTGTQFRYGKARFAKEEAFAFLKLYTDFELANAEAGETIIDAKDTAAQATIEMGKVNVPNAVSAGLAPGGDVFVSAKAAFDISKLSFTIKNSAGDAARAALAATYEARFAVAEHALSIFRSYYDFKAMKQGCLAELKSAALDLASACYNYKVEATKLNALSDAVAAEISTAETLLTKRENLRKRQVDQLSQLRYNEMFFRRIRDKTLTRYQTAFDLAQKYVFMAAQVYGYETGLGRSDDEAGEAFLAKIVATRALGAFSSDGEPIVADDGDLGLAGYLAQMDANWLVLKPRLGINNPQNYTTWFSLRQELFRIYGGKAGDRKWAEELGKHWVEDIRTTDVYRRHCQAFQSQYGLKDKEPGLVIPFSTTIDFAKNLFGKDLAGGDHGYDSTWYSTRIVAAGVWFEGYNEKTDNAVATAQPQLSATPTVYLIPAGNDCLRTPGNEDGLYNSYTVVDQVIPAPYAIGSTELDDDDWYPSLMDAAWGEASPTVKIRRHPMFRAYYGEGAAQPEDDHLDATRLVGRSVWNDQWYLIIPAGALNADRDLALSVFLNGLDTNRDGKRDLEPVSDIKIGFRTYSQSGN